MGSDRYVKAHILQMQSEILMIEKSIICGGDQEEVTEIALLSLVLSQDPLSLSDLEF